MQGAEISQDTDGTGKGRQRAGIAMEHRPTNVLKTQRQRVQPEKQEATLQPDTPGDKFFGERFCPGHGHHDLQLLYSGRAEVGRLDVASIGPLENTAIPADHPTYRYIFDKIKLG